MTETRLLPLERRAATLRRETNIPVGHKLPNGAIKLAESNALEVSESHIISIVLAVTTGFQPFVTWRRVCDLAETQDRGVFAVKDYCTHGHYFRELKEALADFEGRR